MRMRIAVITLLLLAPVAGSSLVLARETDSASKVDSQQLFIKSLAGDPSKEVNAQSYTFAPGAVLPWHIHPDADEIAYMVEGTFTFQRAGEQAKVLHAGEADYVEPNVVHAFALRMRKARPSTMSAPARKASPLRNKGCGRHGIGVANGASAAAFGRRPLLPAMSG